MKKQNTDTNLLQICKVQFCITEVDTNMPVCNSQLIIKRYQITFLQYEVIFGCE